MPEVLLKLTSLTSLNLAGIGMPQLPADFFSALPHLEVLDLSHNQLPSLPADIARATSMRVLNISNNPFTRLPNAILHLGSLEEFYAKYAFLQHSLTFHNQQCSYMNTATWLRRNACDWPTWSG
jgi:hypothetical protein